MNYTEIVKKLIGNIQPCGDSSIDAERAENLTAMCLLVSDLVSEIEKVEENRDREEYSMKKMGITAYTYLRVELGITNKVNEEEYS